MKRSQTFAMTLAVVAAGLVLHAQAPAAAQGRGGRGQAPQTPRAAAPFDITGYWTAVVTQDWRFRAVTPPKGDYAGLPINAAARQAADAWDPAKDEAAGEQCRAYGAPGIMRIPGRLHITWQDDRTLKLDTDAGTQTRLFAFEPEAVAPAPTWQGTSRAEWELLPGRRGQPPLPTSLKVVTTNLRPGYLRNGVPYSGRTTLTEYYDRVNEPDGDAYLIVTTTIEDPQYLAQPYLYSTHFRRQVDAAGWSPSPCRGR